MPKQARAKPSKQIRAVKSRTGVFNTTFILNDAGRIAPTLEITQEQADMVAKAIEENFTRWWDSWIEPELEHLAKRGF